MSTYGFPKEEQARLEERFDFVAREAFGMTEIGTALFVPIEATEMTGSGSCGVSEPFRECRIADEDGKDIAGWRGGRADACEGRESCRAITTTPRRPPRLFHGEWFRTGDLFRQDERGYFYIVGRVKDMIRRSGENIAAREVEDVVLRIPGVFEAACVPVPDARRGEEIKLLVVLQPEISKKELTPTLILEHCRSKLAPFKVPRYIAYADALPKTGSNKVAKGELRASANLTAGCFDSVQNTWL